MSERVDIRIPLKETNRVLGILDHHVEIVNWLPPASGPEVELTLRNISEERAVELVTTAGFTVLASRTRSYGAAS